MKFKITPEYIESDRYTEARKVFYLSYKDTIFSLWKTWWLYNSLEEAEAAIPEVNKEILRRKEEKKSKEDGIRKHLNQKVIYKEL